MRTGGSVSSRPKYFAYIRKSNDFVQLSITVTMIDIMDLNDVSTTTQTNVSKYDFLDERVYSQIN